MKAHQAVSLIEGLFAANQQTKSPQVKDATADMVTTLRGALPEIMDDEEEAQALLAYFAKTSVDKLLLKEKLERQMNQIPRPSKARFKI
ncbi:hypothetical protein [Pandoraea sputorum]|uniref:hypothetical protein n=1 Tax=Pandoraea sputorum TaxID=93222 RepID=UPI002B2D3204|nr:hypothetical protein THI4931_09600 [Pandoraea sputorum]